MKNKTLIFIACVLLPFFGESQNVTTIFDKGAEIDDDMAIGKDGAIYGSGFDKGIVFKISKTEVSIFADEGIDSPNGLAFDKDDNLLVVDFKGNKIHKITPAGDRTILVDSLESPSGLIRSPFAGDTFYFTQYTKNRVDKLTSSGEIIPFIEGDSINGIQGPVGLAFDSLKNLYVANFEDSKIHKVAPDGTISYLATVPGDFYLGFITYAQGYLFGTSWGHDKIYRIDLQGNVKLFAGSVKGSKDGPALEAQFDWPNGIIASKNGDSLYVSDYASKDIRIISPLDVITDYEEIIVSELKGLNALSVSSFQKNIKLNFNLDKSTNVSIAVFSIDGKKLLENYLGQKVVGAHHHHIDLSESVSGMYLVKLSANNGDIWRKVYLRD